MNDLTGHYFFRPLILFFLLFTGLQLASGALIYVWKIGVDPAQTLEYYLGSERMLESYPGERDRFMQPRSFAGLVKVTLGHFLAYGVTVFVLTHLARSLAGRPGRALELACVCYFSLALLEVLSGFLMILVPRFPPALRTWIFFAFTACSAYFLGLLIHLTRRARASATNMES